MQAGNYPENRKVSDFPDRLAPKWPKTEPIKGGLFQRSHIEMLCFAKSSYRRDLERPDTWQAFLTSPPVYEITPCKYFISVVCRKARRVGRDSSDLAFPLALVGSRSFLRTESRAIRMRRCMGRC